MPKSKKSVPRKGKNLTEQLPSSPGINSRSMTPKDVSQQAVTSKDLTERHLASGSVDAREENLLDDAVDLTFPASDPIAISSPTRISHARDGRSRM